MVHYLAQHLFYRVHGAPNDYYRFTKYILKKLLFNFKNKKIENLGYVLTACYSIISDYTKLFQF